MKSKNIFSNDKKKRQNRVANAQKWRIYWGGHFLFTFF
ncbi:MAG: hypothetical protein RL757_2560 [Bacteroidota bacterium]|jgi:hypothetical protein